MRELDHMLTGNKQSELSNRFQMRDSGEQVSGKDDWCTGVSVTPLRLLMGLEAARTRCRARQLVRAASVTPFDLQNLLGLLLLEETC